MADTIRMSGTQKTERQGNLLRISLGDELVRKSLARQAYEALERSIVEGLVAPGTRLSEEGVAAVFSVSRGPAREAITELERVGLAERLPNRDRRVTVPSEKFIQDTFDTWTVLECERIYAASLVAGSSRWSQLDSLLVEMDDLAKGEEPEKVGSVTARFHEALERDCPNQQINRVSDDFGVYISWFRNLYFDYQNDPADLALGDHQRIVEAFKAKDKGRLFSVLQAHLAYHRDRVLYAWRKTNAERLIADGEAREFELVGKTA